MKFWHFIHKPNLAYISTYGNLASQCLIYARLICAIFLKMSTRSSPRGSISASGKIMLAAVTNTDSFKFMMGSYHFFGIFFPFFYFRASTIQSWESM